MIGVEIKKGLSLIFHRTNKKKNKVWHPIFFLSCKSEKRIQIKHPLPFYSFLTPQETKNICGLRLKEYLWPFIPPIDAKRKSPSLLPSSSHVKEFTLPSFPYSLEKISYIFFESLQKRKRRRRNNMKEINLQGS